MGVSRRRSASKRSGRAKGDVGRPNEAMGGEGSDQAWWGFQTNKLDEGGGTGCGREMTPLGNQVRKVDGRVWAQREGGREHETTLLGV